MRSFVAHGVVLIAIAAVGWSVNQIWADMVTLHFTGAVTNIYPDVIDTIGGKKVVDVGDKITCSDLITSERLLDNSARSLLELTENKA